MRLAGTYAVVAALLVMAGALVWAYISEGRTIPEVAWGALVALIGTITGYVWRKGGGESK